MVRLKTVAIYADIPTLASSNPHTLLDRKKAHGEKWVEVVDERILLFGLRDR